MGSSGSRLILSTLLLLGWGGAGSALAEASRLTLEERAVLAARTKVVARAEAEAAAEALQAANAQLKAEKVREAVSDLKAKNETLDTRTERLNAENLKAAQADRSATARSVNWAETRERAGGLIVPAPAGGLDLSRRFGVACTRGRIDAPDAYKTYFPVPDASTALDTRPIREFAACYRRRAAQVQLGSDIASWTTGTALVGLLVAGNTMAPKKTTVMWTSGAIVPLILNDLRGSGYRAQLYSAGADALDQVALRYNLLAFRLKSAKVYVAKLEDRRDKLHGACASLAQSIRLTKTLPDTARRTILLEGVQAVADRCDAAARTHRRLRLILSGIQGADGELQLYATDDALRVAGRMDLLQRALRASPFEVFRSIAKLPFATVEALISGDGLKPRGDPRSDLSYLVSGRRLNPETPALPEDLEFAMVLSKAVEQALAEYESEAVTASRSKLSADEKKRLRTDAENSRRILASFDQAREELEMTIPLLNEARAKTAAVLYWDKEAIPSLDPRLIDKRVLSLSTVVAEAEPEVGTAGKAGADH